MRCLQRAREKGASSKSAVRIAASVLTKAAIDRGSKDNVTVVVVDLKAPLGVKAAVAVAACPAPPAPPAAAAAAAAVAPRGASSGGGNPPAEVAAV